VNKDNNNFFLVNKTLKSYGFLFLTLYQKKKYIPLKKTV